MTVTGLTDTIALMACSENSVSPTQGHRSACSRRARLGPCRLGTSDGWGGAITFEPEGAAMNAKREKRDNGVIKAVIASCHNANLKPEVR